MNYNTKLEGYYNNHRPEMQDLLPQEAKKILDVGCGKGAMSTELKSKFDLEIWGIEFMKEEANIAKENLDKIIVGTVEECIEELPKNYFDVIYFNDVLEHLANPYDVLAKVKDKLNKEGIVISSIPNVRYHKVLRNYIFKRDWKYEKEGVMDFTHLRFFTSSSIIRMYKNAGYDVIEHKGINKTKSIMPYLYNIFLFFTGNDLFYLQFATKAKKIIE